MLGMDAFGLEYCELQLTRAVVLFAGPRYIVVPSCSGGIGIFVMWSIDMLRKGIFWFVLIVLTKDNGITCRHCSFGANMARNSHVDDNVLILAEPLRLETSNDEVWLLIRQ